MEYARKKLAEMRWWHRFRLATIVVLSFGAAAFFLYFLCELVERPLEQLERTFAPDTDAR